MSPEVTTALIAGVVGLVTGAIGSLIAPWVNWGIEKRRKQQDHRANLIAIWRGILGNTNFQRKHLTSHATYGVLQPLLSAKAIEQIHRSENEIIIVQGQTSTNYADLILLQSEIARVERIWQLV